MVRTEITQKIWSIPGDCQIFVSFLGMLCKLFDIFFGGGGGGESSMRYFRGHSIFVFKQ